MKLRHVIIGLTLLVGVTLLGSIDVTISDRRGDNIPLSESAVWKDASITRFRVDNYNVQRGKGEDGVRDLTRAAAVLQGADIAGIQELSGTLSGPTISRPFADGLSFCPDNLEVVPALRGFSSTE